MSSTKQYLDYILNQLSGLSDVSYRAMMGEFIVYYRGRIIGGIYDDRFMVKRAKSVENMGNIVSEVPYDGAKEMFRIDDIDDAQLLCDIVKSVYQELYMKK